MEQWSNGRCEASGDVYSLGLMLAEMAKGSRVEIIPPFCGIRQDVVANDSVGAMNFNAIIKKMTQMYAINRHQSMAEVILELMYCG